MKRLNDMLKDIYFAEKKISDDTPLKMEKAVGVEPELKAAFAQNKTETEGRGRRTARKGLRSYRQEAAGKDPLDVKQSLALPMKARC